MSSYDWVAAATSAAAAHISAAASPTAAAAAAAAAADAAAPRATAAVAASGVPPAIASAVCRGGRGDLVHHQPVPLEAVKARKVPLTHGAVEGAPLLVHRLDMLRQVAALREEPAALLFGALKRSKLEMHHPVVLLHIPPSLESKATHIARKRPVLPVWPRPFAARPRPPVCATPQRPRRAGCLTAAAPAPAVF